MKTTMTTTTTATTTMCGLLKFNDSETSLHTKLFPTIFQVQSQNYEFPNFKSKPCYKSLLIESK